MKKNCALVYLFCNIFLFGANIVCVCYVYPRQVDLDYLGIIVAILAILVTVLVTWNILGAINVKNEMKDFELRYSTKLDRKVSELRTEIVNVREKSTERHSDHEKRIARMENSPFFNPLGKQAGQIVSK